MSTQNSSIVLKKKNVHTELLILTKTQNVHKLIYVNSCILRMFFVNKEIPNCLNKTAFHTQKKKFVVLAFTKFPLPSQSNYLVESTMTKREEVCYLSTAGMWTHIIRFLFPTY